MRIPMRIPKRFKGHAAYTIRALAEHYKPLSKVDMLALVYDPTDEGPEVEIINFFKIHPRGIMRGRERCLHV